VGQSYVPVDFVVIETGVDEKAPVILGRPFLCTTKAIIYTEYAKIVLSIKDKKERFAFKNRILKAPAAPKEFYQQEEQEQQPMPKKKNNRNNRRWRRTKHVLGILNANRKIRKRTDTDVAFTREYSRVSIFHRERECTN